MRDLLSSGTAADDDRRQDHGIRGNAGGRQSGYLYLEDLSISVAART
jgi:hypothetical protein